MHPMWDLKVPFPVVKFPCVFLGGAFDIEQKERGDMQRGQRQAKHITADPIVHHALLGDGR